MGYKITKIHRAIEYYEDEWMKPYIQDCVEKRKNSKTDFENNFYKLCMNAVFGKTVENVRNRQNIKLVTNKTKLNKLVSRISFKSDIAVSNEKDNFLALVSMRKDEVNLNKPIYTGQAILDLSKEHMYDFHYNTVKAMYPGDRSQLLMTNTDSLVYEIKTKDVYKEFWKYKEEFDFSGYPKGSKYYDKTNKKVVGKFKDECNGNIVRELIRLKSKMYCVVMDNDFIKGMMKAKGIQKNVVKKFKRDLYYNTLFEENQTYVVMNTIRSYNQQLYSMKIVKKGTNPYDDKVYLYENGYDSRYYR